MSLLFTTAFSCKVDKDERCTFTHKNKLCLREKNISMHMNTSNHILNMSGKKWQKGYGCYKLNCLSNKQKQCTDNPLLLHTLEKGKDNRPSWRFFPHPIRATLWLSRETTRSQSDKNFTCRRLMCIKMWKSLEKYCLFIIWCIFLLLTFMKCKKKLYCFRCTTARRSKIFDLSVK